MAFRFGNFFTVLDPSNREDKERIMSELEAPSDGQRFVGRRICDLMMTTARAVVLEDEYIDLDYRAGYARFYIYSHFEAKRRCRRLHFFAKDIKNELGLLDMTSLSSKAYLGYVIVRPFQTQLLGRSVFSERVLWASSPRGCEAYLTCRANHRANVAGNELNVMGAPWMQQDTLVSACASASLWVVNWHMSHKCAPEFREYYTPQITDLAVQSSMNTGRAMPSEGLSFGQMLYALREMGYDPMPIEPRTATDARRALYQYVESGIPVILSLDYPVFEKRGSTAEGHTVTAVGHTLDRSREPLRHVFATTPFCRTSDFVPHFVIQDDAVGPFCFLELVDWTAARKDDLVQDKLQPLFIDEEALSVAKERYPCVLVIDRGRREQRVGLLNDFIIPLPPGITLSGDAAEGRALTLIASWYRLARKSPPALVFRTFLQRSNELKASWSVRRGMPESLAKQLRSHLYPRWVWVTEVGTYQQFVRDEGAALGQIIQDSASAGDTAAPFRWLAFHMPPGDLQTTDPYGEHSVVPIDPYESFPVCQRPHREERD